MACKPLQRRRGNFSNSLRSVVRAQTTSLRRQISNLDKLKVPASVIKKMTIKPRLTLMNERFYVQCRRTWAMPYSLQWEEQRAVNINEEAKQSLGGNGFSYFTGKNRSERDGRRHYQDSGITSAAVAFRPRVLRQPRKKISTTARAASLAVLRRFAAEFQGAPQQVVTSKGKEKSGTLPGVHFEPGAAVPPSEGEQKQAVAALFARAAADNPAQLSRSGGAETMVVFAAMDIVIIKADKRLKLGDVWLAELRDSLVATKRGASVKFNMERLAVRYFKEGGSLQYNFEMPGHVYYNQIFGSIRSLSRRRFEGLPVSLISFQISEDEYQRARQLVSGAAGPPPITQEFDEFEDDDDACGGDDDDALAQYEAAQKRHSKLTAAHSQAEEEQQDVGEGMPASSAAATKKPRRAPTDRSAAIETMYAECAKRRK